MVRRIRVREPRSWTPQDDERLLALAAIPGVKLYVLSKKFNVTVQEIKSRVSFLTGNEIEHEVETYSVDGVTLRRYSIQDNVKLGSDEREILLIS